MKILQVEAEMFHEDEWTGRHTDMPKLIVAFRNFCERPKTANKNGKTLLLTNAPIHVSRGMKMQRNQGSGRVLLGDSTGGGAVMLRPIRFQFGF
jgi:hypothetical protein